MVRGKAAESRGQAIKRRMVKIGMTPTTLGREAGVDRGTVKRAIDDLPTVRDTTYTALELALDAVEELTGENGPDNPRVAQRHHLVPARIVELEATTTEGVRFAVKGPVDDAAALEAMILRLIAKPHHGGAP